MKGIEALEASEFVEAMRGLWRRASSRARPPVELYAKITERCRAVRESDGRVSSHHVRETGLACRIFESRGGPRFAAAAGFSSAAIDWAIDRAVSPGTSTSPERLDPGAAVAERLDLDPAVPLPSRAELHDIATRNGHIEWVEYGTTLEGLVGAEGWLTCRRRNRSWGLHMAGGLWACRGFEPPPMPEETVESGHSGSNCFLVEPEAAATLLEALVRVLAQSGDRCGPGLEISDEPTHSQGLAGGEFDDAGFPTSKRALTMDGHWVGAPVGPGSLWRSSFREPPTSGQSNLLALPTSAPMGVRPTGVRACRVFPLADEIWVLDLETYTTRIAPGALALAIRGAIGPQRVTSRGPILPSLLIEGI